MEEKELQALISQGEGFHLEFKESINSNLAKEIVAFANAKGGIILVGVDDNGNIKNKVLSNGDRSKIQSIARECDPSVDIKIETVDQQPNVLVLRVDEGENKPYRCTGGFYLREGASSVKRNTLEIKEMYNDAGWFSFDDKLCIKADFDTHFSASTLKRFFSEAGKPQMLSNTDALHNLGVLEFVEDKPVFNNTGVLFFTKSPTTFLPQSLIQCVRYNGVDKIDIADQQNLDYDILKNIDEVFAFLRRSLSVRFDFETGDPKRKVSWEIPYVAIREAVVNAVAHRDYNQKGSHIQIEVFDDRLSITNYGGLVKGLTESDLGKKSLHRNPNIVNLLHRANYIEKLGTGILRINKELKEAGLPKAKFELSEHWFTIIFSRSLDNDENQSSLFSSVLSETQIKVLNFCKSAPKSRAQIFSHLGMSNATKNYNNHVEPLVELDYLNMTIPNKPTSRNQKYFTTYSGKKALFNI